jgi:hypothetical protein
MRPLPLARYSSVGLSAIHTHRVAWHLDAVGTGWFRDAYGHWQPPLATGGWTPTSGNWNSEDLEMSQAAVGPVPARVAAIALNEKVAKKAARRPLPAAPNFSA